MMGHLTECAICGVTLHYETNSELCDEHLPFGGLQLLVQRGTCSDWYGGPHKHAEMLTMTKDELRRRGFFISERGWRIEVDDLARHRWYMWDRGYRGEDEKGRAA